MVIHVSHGMGLSGNKAFECFEFRFERRNIGLRRTRALSKRSGLSRAPQSPMTSFNNSWILIFTCLSRRRPFGVAS